MDTGQTIAEIEWLERTFAVPDTRPLRPTDLSAANRQHDEANAHSPWFRLLAALWRLLPTRVSSTSARGNRELGAAGSNIIIATRDCGCDGYPNGGFA